ncbi:MAG: GNAT family N-acetyltransferase [Prevotella sp.]|nr:GNAT family N-acetyltransferase [Prevotella sp.]
MEIKIYKPEYKKAWDAFVDCSKNGTFLHCRDFIEYHGDRFEDYSLMFYIGGELLALMPGHITGKVYYSHQGLTYGGLIMSPETTTSDVLTIFEYLTVTLRHQGIKQIVYKAIPHMYHRLPSEEDLYALFRYNAVLSVRNISSTILLPNEIKYSASRKNGLKKAEKNRLTVLESGNFSSFWKILEDNLSSKYDKTPVHSLAEITYIKEKFQDNIHLYTVADPDNKISGGCLIFEMENIVHAQYTAATGEGKGMGVIDLLIDHIIRTYSHKTYFDYGISTENNGLYLNENLIYQKEGFGARGTVYDIYTINL